MNILVLNGSPGHWEQNFSPITDAIDRANLLLFSIPYIPSSHLISSIIYAYY